MPPQEVNKSREVGVGVNVLEIYEQNSQSYNQANDLPDKEHELQGYLEIEVVPSLVDGECEDELHSIKSFSKEDLKDAHEDDDDLEGENPLKPFCLFCCLEWMAAFRRWVSESTVRCWVLLYCCILNECYATFLTKQASETANIGLLAVAMVMFSTSLTLFGVALTRIEIGVGYAVWSAVGTFSASIVGMIVFGESRTTTKLLSILSIVVGIVGLNLAPTSPPKSEDKQDTEYVYDKVSSSS